MALKKDICTALAIFIASLLIFLLSPIRVMTDSTYAMMFAEQLLRKGSFSLEPEAFPALRASTASDLVKPAPPPYQLERMGDRIYYVYPPGSVLLSAPYVGLANLLGFSIRDANGVYQHGVDKLVQFTLAALLMAGFAVVVFLTSRSLLPLRWSALISIGTVFGTQVWSTASRVVWSHTWGIFILGLVVWQIVRAETGKARLRPVLLATCLSWMYFCRPTFGIAIAAIAIYVLLYHRAILPWFVVTGGLWLAGFVAWSEYHYGRLLPRYYQQPSFQFTSASGEALAATLISPARGLLIYVPVLLFVFYLLVRYRVRHRALLVLSVAVVAAHLIMLAAFEMWWGGHCYGARLATDLVPWFALLGLLGIEAWLGRREQSAPGKNGQLRFGFETAVGLILLSASIALNGVGALWGSAWRWNAEPENIDRSVARVWDWKHPQFMGAPETKPASQPKAQ